MLDNAGNNDLMHQKVKNWLYFINLVIDDFVYMYHHKIPFYDKSSKLGHKGQWSRSYSAIF